MATETPEFLVAGDGLDALVYGIGEAHDVAVAGATSAAAAKTQAEASAAVALGAAQASNAAGVRTTHGAVLDPPNGAAFTNIQGQAINAAIGDTVLVLSTGQVSEWQGALAGWVDLGGLLVGDNGLLRTAPDHSLMAQAAALDVNATSTLHVQRTDGTQLAADLGVLFRRIHLSWYVSAVGLGIDNSAALQKALDDAAGGTLLLDVPGVIGIKRTMLVRSNTRVEWTRDDCVVTARDDFEWIYRHRVERINETTGLPEIVVEWNKSFASLFMNYRSYRTWFMTRDANARADNNRPETAPVKIGLFDWFLAGRPVESGDVYTGTPVLTPATQAYYRDEDIVFVNPRINGRMAAIRALKTASGEMADAGFQQMNGIGFDGVLRPRVEGGVIEDCCGDGVYVGGSGSYQWGEWRWRPSEHAVILNPTVRRVGRNGVSATQCSGLLLQGGLVEEAEFAGFDFEPDWMGFGFRFADILVDGLTVRRIKRSQYHGGGPYGLIFTVGSHVTEAHANAYFPTGIYRNFRVDGVESGLTKANQSGPGEVNNIGGIARTQPAYGYGLQVACAPHGFIAEGYSLDGAEGTPIVVTHGRGVRIGKGEIVHNSKTRGFFWTDGGVESNVNTRPAIHIRHGESPNVWLNTLESITVESVVVRMAMQAATLNGGVGVWVQTPGGEVVIREVECISEGTLAPTRAVIVEGDRVEVEGVRTDRRGAAPAFQVGVAVGGAGLPASHTRIRRPRLRHVSGACVLVAATATATRIDDLGRQATTAATEITDAGTGTVNSNPFAF